LRAEDARLNIRQKRKAAFGRPFSLKLSGLIPLVYDRFAFRLRTFFLDDRGVIARFLFLDNGSVVIAVVGAYGDTRTDGTHANANMRIIRECRRGQTKSGSRK
jgi:hypothetical protein